MTFSFPSSSYLLKFPNDEDYSAATYLQGCHNQRKSQKKLIFSRSNKSQGILHQVREIQDQRKVRVFCFWLATRFAEELPF